VPAAAEPAASREDLLTLIAVLREQNVVLAERCAGLEEQNERLTARVAELERRLDRNSKNSNFPPSQDVFGLSKDETTAAKPKLAGKRGKRKGAPGAGLAMVEEPHRVRDHRPDACRDCGEDLRGVPSAGFVRRQVSDVPLVTVQVTEHRLHKVLVAEGERGVGETAGPQQDRHPGQRLRQRIPYGDRVCGNGSRAGTAPA
jgi:transposase